MSASGVSASNTTTQSTHASAASRRARAPWGTSGRSEASLFTPTTSAVPSARAASSRLTCPTWSRSNTPFVKTTGPGWRCRQAAASSGMRSLAAVFRGGAELQRLRRLGVEGEGMVEEREMDGLAVLALDDDLPWRAAADDLDVLSLVRQADVLRRRLDATPDRTVI